MKLISLLLCFCLSFNVLAASGTVQELERHLDEYQYAMTVEWDQKDQAFYQQKNQEFFENLTELMQQGLTKNEVIALAEKKIANKSLVDILKLKFSLAENSSDINILAKILQESSKEFYQQGASWNGEVFLWSGFGLLLAFAIWFEVSYKCVEYDYRYDCDYYYNSGYRNCGYDRYCLDYKKRH